MNKSKIKIIFVDIDWTILDHYKHDWDYVSLEGLKKAQENGVKVIYATARPYESALQQGSFDFIQPDGIVCANGGIAIIDNKCIFSLNIPNELVKETIDFCSSLGLAIEVNTEMDRFLTLPVNENIRQYLTEFFDIMPPVRKYNNENVSSMLLFAPKEMDEIINEKFGKDFDCVRFATNGVDLNYYEMNKSLGMKAVLEYYGFSKEEAMSIGDQEGDLHMFELADYKVAMGNGKDKLKESATYVAKSVQDSGVLDALIHYEVI